MISRICSAAALLGLGLTLATTPVLAQGKGKPNQDRDRVEERDRGWQDILGVGEDERGRRGRGNGAGKVPPGWCRGVGNPHNTPENCGYGSSDRNIDRRVDRRGSYDMSHEEFHRQLDERYRRLAADRPLDIGYQLELRTRKSREHEEWHARTGIGH